MLNAALSYAALGWSVIPIELDSKAPIAKLVPNGVAHATCDSEVIEYWWTRRRSANIGIACLKFLVADIDPRNGGDVQLAALLDQHGPFPTTPTQRTGGGGYHYLFQRPAMPLAGKLTSGIDLVTGVRRYILGAPSIVSTGKQYEWLVPPSEPLAEAPAWLLELGRKGVKQATAASVSGNSALSSSDRVARGRRYAERLEPAVSGQNGSFDTMTVVAKLVHKVGLSADETFEALGEWNARCQPPWSDNDLRRKIDHVVSGAGRERRTA